MCKSNDRWPIELRIEPEYMRQYLSKVIRFACIITVLFLGPGTLLLVMGYEKVHLPFFFLGAVGLLGGCYNYRQFLRSRDAVWVAKQPTLSCDGESISACGRRVPLAEVRQVCANPDSVVVCRSGNWVALITGDAGLSLPRRYINPEVVKSFIAQVNRRLEELRAQEDAS